MKCAGVGVLSLPASRASSLMTDSAFLWTVRLRNTHHPCKRAPAAGSVHDRFQAAAARKTAIRRGRKPRLLSCQQSQHHIAGTAQCRKTRVHREPCLHPGINNTLSHPTTTVLLAVAPAYLLPDSSCTPSVAQLIF